MVRLDDKVPKAREPIAFAGFFAYALDTRYLTENSGRMPTGSEREPNLFVYVSM